MQQHYFAIKKIGQKSSSNAIGSDTVITVTISPSMDLATSSGLVSTIIIDGLLGSETGDSSNLAISPKSEAHITSNDLFSTVYPHRNKHIPSMHLRFLLICSQRLLPDSHLWAAS